MLANAAFTSQVARLGSGAGASLWHACRLVCGIHTSSMAQGPMQGATSTTPHNAPGQQIKSTLQGTLGFTTDEVHRLLTDVPALANVTPSVLQERMAQLRSGLGLSGTRLRSLILQKPVLLSEVNVRELRSMAGINK